MSDSVGSVGRVQRFTYASFHAANFPKIIDAELQETERKREGEEFLLANRGRMAAIFTLFELEKADSTIVSQRNNNSSRSSKRVLMHQFDDWREIVSHRELVSCAICYRLPLRYKKKKNLGSHLLVSRPGESSAFRFETFN